MSQLPTLVAFHLFCVLGVAFRKGTAYKYVPATVKVAKRKTDMCSVCEDLMNLRYHACDYWAKLQGEYDALRSDCFAPVRLPDGEGQHAIEPEGNRVIDMMGLALNGSEDVEPVGFIEEDRRRVSEIIDLAGSLCFHKHVAKAQMKTYKESVDKATKRGSRKVVARFDFAGTLELKEERESKKKWGKSVRGSALGFYVRSSLINRGAPTYIDVLSECLVHSSEHAAAQVLLMIKTLRTEAGLRPEDELELW